MGNKSTKNKDTKTNTKEKCVKKELTRDEMLDKAENLQKEDLAAVKRIQTIIGNIQGTYNTRINKTKTNEN